MLKCCISRSSSITEDIEGPAVHRTTIGPDGIKEGFAYFIRAHVLAEGDRFLIDFVGDDICTDVVLRISVRVSTKSFERSSRFARKWTENETILFTPVNIENGREFEIQVFFTKKTIFIALDGMHATTMEVTFPYSEIRNILCLGDIDVGNVERKYIKTYPLRRHPTPHVVPLSEISERFAKESNESDTSEGAGSPSSKVRKIEKFLQLPFYATFPEAYFDRGNKIIITGKVLPDPGVIRICLQWQDIIWPTPEIPLQVDFRFRTPNNQKLDEPEIYFDCCTSSKYCGAVRCKVKSGLQQNSEFKLVIVRGSTGYQVTLNDQNLMEYPYRRSPKFITACLVQGHLGLRMIQIEK